MPTQQENYQGIIFGLSAYITAQWTFNKGFKRSKKIFSDIMTVFLAN